jgi:hypothetical protein
MHLDMYLYQTEGCIHTTNITGLSYFLVSWTPYKDGSLSTPLHASLLF